MLIDPPNSPSYENNQNIDNDLYEDICHNIICNSRTKTRSGINVQQEENVFEKS